MNLNELAKKVLSDQPFSVLLGVEVGAIEPGRAELVIPVRPELRQQHGFLHGGVVSYAADNAITFAGGSVLGDSVTSEFKINYVRPAIGEKLVARAEALHVGKRQAVCRCDIFMTAKDGELKLCAIAQGTVNKIEPKD
jgi:uncharacterized protein (TIGR00369 family)